VPVQMEGENLDSVDPPSAAAAEAGNATEERAARSCLATLLRGLLDHVDPRRVNVSSSGDPVTLPKFVPGRDTPQQWVDEVSELAADLGWTDSNLLARISGCFEGEAGEWFSSLEPCRSPLVGQLKETFAKILQAALILAN
jgi:hypothetical protein